ncbi:MAG: sodium:solute symporter [Pirellulales bacterium]
MTWIDWLIVVVPCIAVLAVALRVGRYVRNASDFLTAGRAAGRYLVSTADGMAAIGLITAVGSFEVFYNSGFGVTYWSQLQPAIVIAMALFGFVIYRYRETRAMTMAQFFEMRYSKRLRIFMGALAFLAGIINYGVFPIVGARFFIHFCDLPQQLTLGPLTLPMTGVLCAMFLSVALFFVLRGGQMQIMVTDFMQGIICGVLFLVVVASVMWTFSLEQFFAGMADREPGRSMLNPFDTAKMGDFNVWYVAISLFATVYGYMSWQGNSAYNASALNPHEAKMGKIISGWRMYSQTLMFTILGLAAVAVMHAPGAKSAGEVDWTSASAAAHAKIDAIVSADGEQIGKQMTVPVAISQILPVGVKGSFVAIMLFMMVACDITYLLSWGSILVQDVLLPIRGKHLAPEEHLKWLRLSIVGVAVFAFLFSMFVPMVRYIFFFMNITGAIYMGGSGAVIIGGLYWKRATTAGAWSAMLVGSGLAVAGLILPIYVDMPFNDNWMMLIAMLSGIVAFVVVSLATCRAPHDMQQLLHRGQYAIADDQVAPGGGEKLANWKRVLLGYDENFTRGDRFLSATMFGWTALIFLVFIGITLSNAVFGVWSERGWWRYFVINNVYMPLVVGVITTVWLTAFGLRDLRRLFERLRTLRSDASDDGLVSAAPSAATATDAKGGESFLQSIQPVRMEGEYGAA